MGRIKIAFSDSDSKYIESLSAYLMGKQGARFNASYFTDRKCLVDFLQKDCLDILVAGEGFTSDSIPAGRVKRIVMLENSGKSGDNGVKSYIGKYQHVDIIIRDIMKAACQLEDEGRQVYPGRKNTKVTAVYSPIGGCGKTTLAASFSTQCSSIGLSVFYLSLESIQSVSKFFNCDGEQNLSRILFSLGSGHHNLPLLFEGCKSVDTATGVSFFNPPENGLEISGMTIDEIKKLIGLLKEVKTFDMVFIDMASFFCEKTLAVMELCDEIVLVSAPGEINGKKIGLFLKSIDGLGGGKASHILEKIVPVVNKSISGTLEAHLSCGETLKMEEGYRFSLFDSWQGFLHEDKEVQDKDVFSNEVAKFVQRYS